jgi:hypothetical protein
VHPSEPLPSDKNEATQPKEDPDKVRGNHPDISVGARTSQCEMAAIVRRNSPSLVNPRLAPERLCIPSNNACSAPPLMGARYKETVSDGEFRGRPETIHHGPSGPAPAIPAPRETMRWAALPSSACA